MIFGNLRLWRNIKLGVKNLLLHKLRSMLTMLGVVFGVGSVVAMLSVGEGASKEQLERIRALGSDKIIIESMKAIEEESGAAMRLPLSVYGLLYEDEKRISEVFPQVKHTVPAKIVRREGRLGERVMDLRVVGTTPTWFELVKREKLAGRALLDNDMGDKSGVVVLTETGARKLLAAESSIGQSLRIDKEYFEVIGIVRNESSKTPGLSTPDQDVDAYVPITAARERFGDINSRRTSGSFERERVELHQMIVQVDSTDDVEKVADGISAMLKRFHKKTDYRMTIPLALLREREATKRTFNIVLGSIAGISLLVGGIGIMNIMLASVTERTREIGIRRAIGAKRMQIVIQFLIETTVLSTIGGAIGIGIGVALPWIITYNFNMPTVVTGQSLVLSFGVSMAIGLFFGLYPAVRAANLDPIVALRHE
jgi:putative ABC transport system permease protein